MKNYQELVKELSDLYSQQVTLRCKLQELEGYHFIKAVEDKAELLSDLTQMLIEELHQRNEPMTYRQIEQVFINSGYSYTMKDILACNPDTQKTINEQIAHYKE